MNFSKKILSQTVTQICLSAGVDRIVISPGSRNAPLTIGFTQHPDFTCYSIVDERCAAFFALGMAQQLHKPVALVCTSGSALLNYYPAIAEAFYSNIPLVVISADRPEHLIDVGDGQTIRQENVYQNHILYTANCKEGETYQGFNEKEIYKALNISLSENGPVHINVPFSEPLYEVTPTLDVSLGKISFDANREYQLNEDAYDNFSEDWRSSERKMVLVGTLPPNSINKEIIELLAGDESVLVFTETTSNLHHKNFFPGIDKIIMHLGEDDFEALRPDVLVTFGGMVVSKKIKAFLRQHQPKAHFHVGPYQGYDTFFSLRHHFKLTVNEFFCRFERDYKRESSGYRNSWLKVKHLRDAKHINYLQKSPFSDFVAHSIIFETLPEQTLLQLANSATVRYSQLFDLDASLHVYCNRGTSGIDGSTSTAIGAAVISEKQTVFITGDLSFFYDSNALWNNHVPLSFRIIILNNGGGGIFRILPKAKGSEHFEQFFETKHDLDASQLSRMYGFEYHTANDEVSLRKELESFYDVSEAPRILEIFTPYQVNDDVLLEYFKFIS
ncbi:MAG: 2-succinyl-5-enolpyruvyl-6-hydroxy-3-cyclohexene-1-carboxylic-acid synthase [Aureisphaera sp.]